MHNVLCAAIIKWLHSPLTWLSFLLSAACGLSAGCLGMAGVPDYAGAARYFEPLPLHAAFAVQLLCIAAVTSLTAGLECAEGSVRNYLSVGCSRAVFYLSQITAALLYAAVSAALMLGVFAAFTVSALDIFPDRGYWLLLGLMAGILLAAAASAAALAVNSAVQVRTLLLTIAGCFVLAVSGLIGFWALHEREPYQLRFDGSGVSLHHTPGYVSGAKRSLLLCLQALNPVGQYCFCAQYLETRRIYAEFNPDDAEQRILFDAADSYRAELDGSAACIAGFAVLCGLAGYLHFERRDLT